MCALSVAISSPSDAIVSASAGGGASGSALNLCLVVEELARACGGIGVGFAVTVLMGVVVGMVIVGQTLYSATIEHLREFATLKAIGATRRDIYRIIVEQALITAGAGFAAGTAIVLLVVPAVRRAGLDIVVPPALLAAVFALTVGMCLAASVVSVRTALRVDPLVVFRT